MRHIDTPSVAIIIATYNREDILIDAVADAMALPYPHLEVVVVDQTGQHADPVHRQLAEWNDAGRVRWLCVEQPGLTHARNVGLQATPADVVIFVDDDVRIPNPAFVQEHVAGLLRTGTAAVAGRVLEPDKPPFVVRSRVGHLGYFGSREPGFGTSFSGPADSVRGCNMAFWRHILMDIGGFDERYTKSAFREDTDISFRLKKAGHRLWFSAEAWLYHLSAPTGGTRDASIRVDEDLMANDCYFAYKNLHPIQRNAWLLRCYASRVMKASLYRGHYRDRQQAFQKAVRAAKAQPGRKGQ